MVMKTDEVLCSMFLLAFLALTLHKTQKLLMSDLATIQQKRFGYVTHV